MTENPPRCLLQAAAARSSCFILLYLFLHHGHGMPQTFLGLYYANCPCGLPQVFRCLILCFAFAAIDPLFSFAHFLPCVTREFFRHTHAPGRAALDRVRSASHGAQCCLGTTPSQRGRSPGRVSGPGPNNSAGSTQLGGILSTHQQCKGKTALAPALALGRREKCEREPKFQKT